MTEKSLSEWLAHCERLHPKEIDMTLRRVAQMRETLGIEFRAPVVMVAGTNGKGSSCALLECMALQAGYRVGLYIKPHFVHFEERCRVNGKSVAANELASHFAAIEAARGELALTYFEFTTLAIARCLAAQELDLVILEVGLGGRLDAVNAFDADVALITSIDIDHVEYLGPDRESIGLEKAHIMRVGRAAVVSDPVAPESVKKYAEKVGADLRLFGRDFNYSGDRQQWSWAGRSKRFNSLAYPALRGINQLLNASGVLAVFEALVDRLPMSAQAVRNGLAMVDLPGRFQIVPGQPALVLDVAHNPHAVAALAQNLDQMGFFPRTIAVFGAMHDKDIGLIMATMEHLIDHWCFTNLPLPRAASVEQLSQSLRDMQYQRKPGRSGSHSVHQTPLEALTAASAIADPADRIVVFGSFYTVGGVMQDGGAHGVLRPSQH